MFPPARPNIPIFLLVIATVFASTPANVVASPADITVSTAALEIRVANTGKVTVTSTELIANATDVVWSDLGDVVEVVGTEIEGLVWHDLRATYGTRLGEAGFNAYDIAKLMGHANIATSQRYVRNVRAGSGEAVLLKNQRRHNTVTSEQSGTLSLVASS